ncbi:transcription elongation factor GreA [Candidatus Microgenomates bacterium]|nr:transcription elongation factor GreA [Candidatus Microgenomates bacterium]
MRLNGKQFHLTADGLAELEKELANLKSRRVEVAENLKEAREQGDLSENSAYATAQDEHKFVENRIDEITHILQNAEVIKNPQNAQNVVLGSTVELSHNGDKLRYTIVGSLEANPESGRLSEDSPVGQAVLGKKVGDSVEITVPSGTETYTISKIS